MTVRTPFVRHLVVRITEQDYRDLRELAQGMESTVSAVVRIIIAKMLHP